MRLAASIIARLRETLVIDGAKILVVNVAGAGLAFISHILFARWLSVESYGIYVFALSLFNILFIAIQAGLNLSAVRLIAEYRARGNAAAMAGLVTFSNAAVLILGGFVAAVGCATIFFMRNDFAVELERTLIAVFGLTIIMALLQQRMAILQGLERVLQSVLLFEILRPALFLVTVWGVARIWDLDSTAVMVANLLVTGAILIGVLPYTRASLRRVAARGEQTAPHWRSLLKVSLPYVAVTGITIVLTQMDVLMIGAILGPEQAALYNPAAKVALLAIFPMVAIRSRFAPMAVTLFTNKNTAALQARTTTATLVSVLTCLCVLAVILPARVPILDLFGPAYPGGASVMVILAIGNLIFSLSGAVEMFFLVGPFERFNALVISLTLGLNVVLNALLIPELGIDGAAYSTVAALIFRGALSGVIVYLRTGILPMTPSAKTAGGSA